MADILLDTQGAPANPSANTGVLYLDSTSKELVNHDDTGAKKTVRTLTKANTADLTANGGTPLYLSGSAITVPPGLVRVGSQFMWRFGLSKSAASTAAPVWTVRVGTAGTTADATILTFTGAAQTAVTDTGSAEIWVVVRSIGAAGVIQGTYTLSHVLAATGLTVSNTDVVSVTSAGFDTTVASSIYGVVLDSGGTAVWTLQHVSAQATSL
jgi:hypothetical protein